MKKRNVALNTDAHRPAFDAFAEHFADAGRREGWRSTETLRKFLEAGARAIRGKTLLGPAFDENEAEYMRIVGACRHPQETMADFAKMLGAVALAMAADPIDFVGPIFSELSADAGMGQFFTPHHLSYMMARMIVSDPRGILDEKPFIALHEPACGVGGMILATNAVLRENGVDVAREAHWHAVDVDYRACCGAYLQIALSDASAVVIHGNTLSLDAWSSMVTPAALFYPKRPESRPAPKPAEPAQLSLL